MTAVHEVSGIGTVRLKRTRRARRIGIRVEAFSGVTVCVPWHVKYATALAMVEKHRLWVIRHLALVHEVEGRYIRTANTGERITRTHVLEAHAEDIDTVGVMVVGGVISVRYPKSMNLDSPTVQKAMRDGVLSAYRMEAKKYLPERVGTLADEHSIHYGRLALKNLRSRWGSCSAANNINLNIQLMRLSDELIDYVILHELAHTRVKNHGIRFWALLQKMTGNAKALDARLRKARVWG